MKGGLTRVDSIVPKKAKLVCKHASKSIQRENLYLSVMQQAHQIRFRDSVSVGDRIFFPPTFQSSVDRLSPRSRA